MKVEIWYSTSICIYVWVGVTNTVQWVLDCVCVCVHSTTCLNIRAIFMVFNPNQKLFKFYQQIVPYQNYVDLYMLAR